MRFDLAIRIVTLAILTLGWACQAPFPIQESGSKEGHLLDQAEAAIARVEYHASRHGDEIQAPNRRQNLRTFFEPSGIRVHDRTAIGNPALVRLSLIGVGRGEEWSPISDGRVTTSGARVEIERPQLVEWYENTPDGIEQGFTLSRRPPGGEPLVLALAVADAQASLLGDRVLLETQAGRTLTYQKLVVFDAEGRSVPARLEVPTANRIQLVVTDAGARYPLTIDPLLTANPETLIFGSQFGARLGVSVAGVGDVNGDGFGDFLAAADAFDSGQTDEGAAFLYLGSAAGIASGTVFAATARIEGDQSGARMGSSVAGAGDVNGDGYDDVILGARLYDSGEVDEGAAFVFLGGATGIASGGPASASARLESNQAGAELGGSVAGAGDVNGDGWADVIVGARLYSGVEAGEGAAFVFLGSSTGIANGAPATAAARLESNQAGAHFGQSVAGAGDLDGNGIDDVVVGANLYDAGQSDEGSAFVFLGGASGIGNGNPSTAATQIESDQANAQLGTSVAGAGDTNGDGFGDLLVDAPFFDSGETDEGAAFVFHGSATGIVDGTPATASTRLESNQAFAALGQSVASAGDVNGDGYADVIVAASAYDAGQTDEGTAFVFLGGPTGIPNGNPTTALIRLESNQPSWGSLGGSVAGAGDVNGDGYSDVVIGIVAAAAPSPNEGGAFLFHGGARGIVPASVLAAATRIESNQAQAGLGNLSAAAGDVNGDGYDDVVVGARFYDSGQVDEGAAFVFHGSANGIVGSDPATAATRLQSNQAGADFGSGVGAIDVNGDGYDDVVVGARYYDSGQTDEGAAFIFLGSATGVADGDPTTAATRLQSDTAGANLGNGATGAGDVNGDGYGDVLVGAWGSSADFPGSVYVYHGGPTGIPDGNPSTAATRLEDFYFAGTDSAGDVNGDGYGDVVVSSTVGIAVFHGRSAGIPSGDPFSASTLISAFGPNAVVGLGDVNGDGFDDVGVGDVDFSFDPLGSPPLEGAAFVLLGSASGLAGVSGYSTLPVEQHAWETFRSGQDFSIFGAISRVGDVNGDGYADLLVAAPLYDSGEVDEGAVFLFLGGPTRINGGAPLLATPTLQSNQASAGLGFVAQVVGGDFNGDGFADLIAPAPSFDVDQTNEGAAFVFHGNATGSGHGRSVLARQLRGDGSGRAVPRWGAAGSEDGFAVRMRATHPRGRGRAKLEVEACAAGVPFSSPACLRRQSPAWVDVGATSTGVEITENFTGLVPNSLYHWRARLLFAPFSITQPGVTPPGKPAHGPWRRLSAQSIQADIRTVPEPAFVTALSTGVALLGLMGRRRREI